VTAASRKRCAIYTRKSTVHGLEQEFNSLDAQRESCEAYIRGQASNGWQLAAAYEDGGFSGANTERPSFQRLLADIEAKKIEVVVVYKVDRLSRSLLDFAKVMDRFNQAGAAFVSVTQNFSTADAMGRLTLNMLMSFAEFEREMISERTRDKIQAARRKGRWTGGAVPLGYDLRDRKLVVNDLEALVIKEIFAIYLEKRSALEVVRLLVSRGRATKQHISHQGKARAQIHWDQELVRRILKNPVYAGFIACGDERFEGEHPAIVDRADFARVQALLAGKRTDKTVAPSRYLLKGLLRCVSCKGSMTPASTRKGGREYRYYRCAAREKRGKEACPSKPVPAQPVEEHVVQRLSDMAACEGFTREVLEGFEKRAGHVEASLEKERKLLSAAVSRMPAESRRVASELAGLTGIARQRAEAQLQSAEERRGQQELRLIEVERELEALTLRRADTTWAAKMLGDFSRLWPMLTPQMQSRLVEVLVEKVEVNRTTGRVVTLLWDLGEAVTATGPAGRKDASSSRTIHREDRSETLKRHGMPHRAG
jgi:DNA invertase Pin-like site-specific DNA recombinase